MKRFYSIVALPTVSLITFILFTIFTNGNGNSGVKNVRTSGAMEALNFWNESRSYPNSKFPDNGFLEEYEKVKLRKKQNDTNSISPDWREMGPHNIGGRTLAIAINPQNTNTIWAGSASAGLWRSYSGGDGKDAWDYVPTGLPVLGVSCITFAGGDSSEMYIGTGEVYNKGNTSGGVAVRETRGSYGIGILKSTDGGSNWRKSLDWSYHQATGVWVIRVNPLNNRIVWAGTTEGTFKSTNAGDSWELVNSVPMVTDLIIHSVDTNTVLIACGNLFSTGKGIYRTDNSGNSWTKLTSNLPDDYNGKANFGVYKSNPDIIYLSIGNGYWEKAGTYLYRTTNTGDTWQRMAATDFSDYRGDYASFQGWYSHFVVVNQSNPELILAAGVDIFKSSDGGNTLQQKSFWYNWYFGRTPAGGPEGPTNYSHADHHAYAIHPDDPNIVYFATDGGIFRTKNFGNSFEGLNGGYQTTQFYNGFSTSISDSNFSIGGMQDNATAIYDGSEEWVRVIGGDGAWTGINQQNNNIAFGSWQKLNIVKLTYGGPGIYFESLISPPASGTVSFIAPFVVSNSNPSILYAGRSTVYKSTNSGMQWTPGPWITVNPPLSMAISNQDPNIVFVATAPVNATSEIFRTTDGGATWLDVKKDLPHSYPMDIIFDPENDNNVYVVFSGFGNSHFFKSTNRGDEWINIGDGLPDVPTSAVAVDPFRTNYLYVGNDLGLYFSPDTGSNWYDMNDGLPDACMIADISISPSNKKLRIATHGSGVYETNLIDEFVVSVDKQEVPSYFLLEQNYPNPFNPITTIEYSLQKSKRDIHNEDKVTLKVFDTIGREIAVLVNEYQSPGTYKVHFDASSLASGIYIYNLSYGSTSLSRKMLLLK